MSEGIELLLKLINVAIKRWNEFIFAYKFSFFLSKILNLSILSFNIIFKLWDFFVFLLSNGFNNIVLVFLKNIFNLREVGLDYISHSTEALKQGRHFLL